MALADYLSQLYGYGTGGEYGVQKAAEERAAEEYANPRVRELLLKLLMANRLAGTTGDTSWAGPVAADLYQRTRGNWGR